MPSARRPAPPQRRDKALLALLMLTGSRDCAMASLRPKHINLAKGCVYQDARDVKTKPARIVTTTFFAVDPACSKRLYEWVTLPLRTAVDPLRRQRPKKCKARDQINNL